MTPIRALALATVLTAAAGLAACEKTVPAPTDVGVCYALAVNPDQSLKFNKVADKQPRIEYCEVQLEKIRLRFISLGSNNREIAGAYQGSYIWVSPEGAFVSQTLKGHRYPSILRKDDGSLNLPTAQPGTPPGQ
ncbi:MAG: hypothetical protein JWP35_123 [Caulobacter sp.]|nr:hypothetical protein [Caulobacter sp.]